MTTKSFKNNNLLLGCIADDITGASDIGLMLAGNGLPTTLLLGVPEQGRTIAAAAIVIALKIRTAPADVAVRTAERAAEWLLSRGARQLYYKYCSTFDSTPSGNIGPVTDALLNLVGEDLTVLLPAFPENQRTVRDGNLYVGDTLLSESPMRHHPLTPMTESFVPALMDAQTSAASTGLITLQTVRSGADAIVEALQSERAAGKRYVVIDTQTDDELHAISDAVVDLQLITGGSGIGAAIPESLRKRDLLEPETRKATMPVIGGNAAVIAGSCSEATRAQISAFTSNATPFVVDPVSLASGSTQRDDIADRAIAASVHGDVLIYSSANAENLRTTQASIGVAKSAAIVEDTLAYVSRRLADAGIRKFIIAGGETSGAVAGALEIDELEIGLEIDPGVPWMVTRTPDPVCVAFKSGNFGRREFFRHALDLLP